MHVRRNSFLAGWIVVLGASSGCTGLLGDFTNGPGDDGGGADATADHVATSEAGPDATRDATPGEGGGQDSTMGDSSGSSSGADTGSSSGADSGSSSGTDAASDASDSGAACTIGGAPYASDEANPNNGCQSCKPATSTSMWTNLADGTSCGNGQVCAVGSCGTQCDIGGTVYASGTANPTNACQTCQPGTSTTQWTTVATGTSCATGEVCNGTSCVAGCYIAGAFDAPGVNPSNACQTCQPGTSTTQWTAVASGTSCATGEVCNGASCASGCFIAGAFDSPGANPSNACQTCQPSTSTTQWTSVTNGTSCGNGQICSGGACGTQCDIGGTVYSSGTANPASSCQTCQPGASTTMWSNLADGTSCGSGNVCNTGACKACAPGQTNPIACGNCGTDTQTCVGGAWQNNTCTGQGTCAPNATQTCNTYGTQTCAATTCTFGACSCPSSPVCSPNAIQCSFTGDATETCDSCGQWGGPVGCGSGETCSGGVCSCASGTTSCSGVCVNESSNNANCGACGHVCPALANPSQGATCTTSVCVGDVGGFVSGGGVNPSVNTNETYFVQFTLPQAATTQSLNVFVTGATGGPTKVNMGIYPNNTNNTPGSLITWGSGQTPNNGVGLVSIPLSTSLAAGVYWIGMAGNFGANASVSNSQNETCLQEGVAYSTILPSVVVYPLTPCATLGLYVIADF